MSQRLGVVTPHMRLRAYVDNLVSGLSRYRCTSTMGFHGQIIRCRRLRWHRFVHQGPEPRQWWV